MDRRDARGHARGARRRPVVAGADVVPGPRRTTRTGARCSAPSASTRCSSARRRMPTARWSLGAAEAGLAVYLEKPVAHTIDDARRSRRRSKATRRRVRGRLPVPGDLVPRRPAARRRAPAGHRRSATPWTAPWLGDRARGGGMMLERASHLIDLERAIAGEVAGVGGVEAGDGARGLAAVRRRRAGQRRRRAGGRRAGLAARARVRRRHGPRGARSGLPRDRGRPRPRHTGPPPVERSLAASSRPRGPATRRGVLHASPTASRTLAVALAAQDDAAQRAAGGRRAD